MIGCKSCDSTGGLSKNAETGLLEILAHKLPRQIQCICLCERLLSSEIIISIVRDAMRNNT